MDLVSGDGDREEDANKLVFLLDPGGETDLELFLETTPDPKLDFDLDLDTDFSIEGDLDLDLELNLDID